jgi:hypothetical protein
MSWRRFFGHSGTAVHQIYQRLGTDDVSDVAKALAQYAPAEMT